MSFVFYRKEKLDSEFNLINARVIGKTLLISGFQQARAECFELQLRNQSLAYRDAGKGCELDLHGQEMIPSFPCIHPIHGDYAGGRAMPVAIAEERKLYSTNH